MAEDKIKLNRESEKNIEPKYTDTTHDEKRVVTTKDPSTTTEYVQPWMLNDDGSINQQLVDYYNEQLKRPQEKYYYDPKKGDINKDTLFNVLNIDPEKLKAQREREMKRNRMKQLGSALYNSGALISDMLSAALGGNVWKRNKDDTAEKAHAANLALQKEQAAEDAALADIVQKQRNAYYDAADAIKKNMERYNRTLKTTSGGGSTRTETGGDTHSVTRGGKERTNGYVEQRIGANSSSGGGGTTTVSVMGSDGKLYTRNVTKDDAKNLANHSIGVYTKAIKGGDQELYDLMNKRGLVAYNSDGELVFDEDKLLKSGYLFYSGTGNPNLSKSIKDYYKRISGDTREIRPVSQKPAQSGGWGVVNGESVQTNEEEYDD